MIKILKYFIFIVILLLHIIWNIDFCWSEFSEGGNASMEKIQELRYKNISTAPSYIKIKFKSSETGEILNMIIENEDMASYLANKQGLEMDKFGRFKDMEAYKNFIETFYIDYMKKNENKVLDIDINDFKKFVSRIRFGDEKTGEKHLNSLIFSTPFSLKDLGVADKNELIEKYFNFGSKGTQGTLKNEYYKEYGSNPAFIALLIDLGFYVGRGDIVPILFVNKME